MRAEGPWSDFLNTACTAAREAAAVLEVDPATFRKRLGRARQRLYDFMRRRADPDYRPAASRSAADRPRPSGSSAKRTKPPRATK